MANRVVLIAEEEAAPVRWELALPADVVVERCGWSRLTMRARSRPAAIVMVQLHPDIVLPLLQHLTSQPEKIPVIVTLTAGFARSRASIAEAGAAQVLVTATDGEVSRLLNQMLGEKPRTSAVAGGWPSTTFSVMACEQALRQFVATSMVPEISDAVPFGDLLPFCKSLTDSDRAALTDGAPSGSLNLRVLVLALRLHGVARSAPRQGDRPPQIDVTTVEDLRREMEALKAEIEAARGGATNGPELERWVARLTGTWREIEGILARGGTLPPSASRPVVPVREATRPPPSPASTVPPPPPPTAARLPARWIVLVGASVLVAAAVSFGWQVVQSMQPSVADKYKGIPAVNGVVATAAGRAIIYVDDNWVPDPPHVDALKRELAARGTVDAQVYRRKSSKMLIEITLPPSKTKKP